jgi:hypothetical protein
MSKEKETVSVSSIAVGGNGNGGSLNNDDSLLAELGYKSEFRREFTVSATLFSLITAKMMIQETSRSSRPSRSLSRSWVSSRPSRRHFCFHSYQVMLLCFLVHRNDALLMRYG